MTEWLQRQLEEEIAGALASGQTNMEFRMMEALAHFVYDKGEYDRALSLYEEVLAKRKHVHGDEHPDTLQSLFHLAHVYCTKREFDRALPMFEECLAKRKRVLGEDHPKTIQTLHNLANLFLHKCKTPISAFDSVFSTLKVLHHVYKNGTDEGLFFIKEDRDRALQLHEECLEKRKRVLGDEHPGTLQSLRMVAVALSNKGEFDRALPLLEECLAKAKRVLGDEHPDTLLSLNSLASLFISKSEVDRALPLLEECLAMERRVLGDEHPDTLDSLGQLASCYITAASPGDDTSIWCMHKFDRGVALLEECMVKHKRILGEEHPQTKNYKVAFECLRAVARGISINRSLRKCSLQ
jgi:tetratricopeptide (TPR) repeat protein